VSVLRAKRSVSAAAHGNALVRLAWRLTCRVKVPCTRTKIFKVDSIPTVTPIDKVLETCGHTPQVGRRKGDRPCEGTYVSKLRGYGQKLATNAARRRPGRCGSVSEPTGTDRRLVGETVFVRSHW